MIQTVLETPINEYLMINSLSVKNFRCFKDLNLSDLRRFNVLVGQSGSGKTALLEALFLVSAANPEVYFRMRGWRGFGGAIAFNGSRHAYESLFRELFYRFDGSETAQIRFIDSVHGSRSLFVRYQSNDKYSMSLKSGAHAFAVDPILFRWKTNDRTYDSLIEMKDGQFVFSGGSSVYPVWYITPSIAESYADRFSELSKSRKVAPVIEAARRLFPDILDLTLESIAGQLVICASMSSLPEKIPTGMISGGFSKFLSILIAIASNAGGLVMIDEIENGLYFKSYTLMLSTIADFCEEHQVQLFMSTHSEEFLLAVAVVMDKRPHDFALIRSELEGGESRFGITRGELAVSAIAQSIEVR